MSRHRTKELLTSFQDDTGAIRQTSSPEICCVHCPNEIGYWGATEQKIHFRDSGNLQIWVTKASAFADLVSGNKLIVDDLLSVSAHG